MTSALEVIHTQLTTASSFAAIFGRLPQGDESKQERHLKKQYRQLVQMTHPDHAAAADKALANTVFPELVRTYERARAALKAGTYDQSLSQPVASATDAQSVVLRSAAGSYTISSEIWAEGDFANLHLGQSEAGDAIFVKVAAEKSSNAFLANEATFSRRVGSLSQATKLRPYLPELLDSFILTEGRNEQYRVNVFRYMPGYVSLTAIHEAYPTGLDPRDAAWIWRRLIAQALAAQVLGVVHGAIVPDHVLVHPATHEPLHIGWVHSVERPQERHARLTMVIDRWRDWYPKEVFAREIPSLQTDLYMVGKTMIYLAGGDVALNQLPSHYPSVMKETVGRLVATNPSDRPTDGVALLRDVTTGIRKHWGTTFRPLTLPK